MESIYLLKYGQKAESVNLPFICRKITYDLSSTSLSKALSLKAGEQYNIFIPIILDLKFASSYDGVNFAISSYLELIQLKSFSSKIILLGAESRESFLMNCDYAAFLKCPNVFYVHANKHYIQKWIDAFAEKEISFNEEDAVNKLKKLSLRIPEGNSTTHGIINQWSIDRWSSYIGIPYDSSLSDVEDNGLYFKYLKTIYPVKELNPVEITKLESAKGRVLLVDDEENKGWTSFFKGLFQKSSDIVFESIGSVFKNMSQNCIIDSTLEKIESFKPDLIILDLRLHADDVNGVNPDDLTGVKILKKIKGFDNKNLGSGIQVLGFTASNKIWNHKQLEKYHVDSILVKESPVFSQSKEYTKNSINDVVNKLNVLLNRAPFIISLTSKMNDYLKILKDKQNTHLLSGNYLTSIKRRIQLGYSLLTSNSFSNESNLRELAYLTIFQVIEELFEESSVYSEADEGLYINVFGKKNKTNVAKRKGGVVDCRIFYDKSDRCYYECPSTSEIKLDTNFRMSSLLIFRYGFKSSNVLRWNEIRDARNNVAHFDTNTITDSEFLALLDFLIYIFDVKNVKD